MKFFIVMAGILVGSVLGAGLVEMLVNLPEKVKEDTLVVLPTVKLNVKVTSYQPTIEQCDSTPFNTASGDNITDSSYFKWCAVSKDLLYRYLNFNDTVILRMEDSTFYKLIVKDIVQGSKHIDVVVPINISRKKMLCGRGEIEIRK